MDALLTSEKFVKETTSISDNIAGKYLIPSIYEAQQVELQSILGTTLYRKLKELVKNGALNNDFSDDFSDDFAILTPDEEPYQAVIKHCQLYLAYKSVAELVMKVSYKIANAGVNRTTDDGVQSVTFNEVCSMREYYQAKADYFAMSLQRWLLTNADSYPELSEHHKDRIKSNLYSAASCGIFLGGKRGK